MRLFALLLSCSVLASSCGELPDDVRIGMSESALTSLVVPGNYRSDATTRKSAGFVSVTQPNNATITTQPAQVNGVNVVKVARYRTDQINGGFPSPCHFNMQAYFTNWSSPPTSSPPGSFAGWQTSWASQAGTCTCVPSNGPSYQTTIPAGAVSWYQTNSGTGYLIEKMAFNACGYGWNSSGALYFVAN